MPLGLLGLKVGMTQVYDADGKIAPVTVIQAGPCPILQVKTKGQKKDGSDRNGTGDGYEALQIGFVDKPRRQPLLGPQQHRPVHHVALQPYLDARGSSGSETQPTTCPCDDHFFLLVGRIITRPPLGPGTAPRTRIRWFSGSMRTTVRLRDVTRLLP